MSRRKLIAWLSVIGRVMGVVAIPAPPFLAEQQFVERVALMLKEAGMSRRRLIVSLSVIACGVAAAAILAVSVFPLKAAPRTAAGAQETQAAPRGPAPILRSVAIKYQGFALNDTTVQEQKEYWNEFLTDAPRVETPYDQKKVDEMKRLITAFWKEKGVEVEVRSTLTPVLNTRRATARLAFNVQETQGASEPVVNASAIETGQVKRGTFYINVRGLGTVVLLNGQPVAKIELPEDMAGEVRAGQSAEVDTHKGIVRGRVSYISAAVVLGQRSVYIALDSAVPGGVDAHAIVEGTIQIDKLENVVYMGRPVNLSAGPLGSVIAVVYKIVDNGKAAERLQVECGRWNDSSVQVLSGLKPGDTVILCDMSAYEKFDRVEIKQ